MPAEGMLEMALQSLHLLRKFVSHFHSAKNGFIYRVSQNYVNTSGLFFTCR